MQRMVQLGRDDSPQEKLSKLEGVLSQHPFSRPDVVPLLASLLSLSLLDRYSPPTLTPQRQRQKTLEVLLAVLLSAAEKWPALFVVEDLQWADPSTLELLGPLIDQAPTAHLLVLLTFRPEFSPPWATCSPLTQIALGRLRRKQVEVMVEKVAGGKTLPTEVRRQLVVKTDGVPLFVEELTKMVLESGLLREAERHYELVGRLPPLAIPGTLHDSLMARLDRLGTAKEVVQLGATRPESGRGLSVVAQEHAAAVSQTDYSSFAGEVPRDRRDPA
jgi:predicted ATPase